MTDTATVAVMRLPRGETRTQALQHGDRPYRGRFAPSPTGPLHFGSLVAAVGSYLQARSQCGEWHVRIEDLDGPRVVAGAADLILRTLERYGLQWDGPVLYQGAREDVYAEVLLRLREAELVYPCSCSRRTVAAAGLHGVDAPVYPGTCRGARRITRSRHSLRVLTPERTIALNDAVQGTLAQDLGRDVGDFVVRRSDGRFAYQMAVVVDDAEQGITEVVRGSDLLNSTPRQLYLQELLGLPVPAYAHLPVAVNHDREKLSKQTHARPLDYSNPVPALWRALAFLGQAPEPALRDAGRDELWTWAVSNWALDKVPRVRSLAVEAS